MTYKAYVPNRNTSRERIEFGHFVLLTDDLDTMSSWYCRVLDMDVVLRTDWFVFLTFDQFHHRLVLAKRKASKAPAPEDRIVDHLAFKCRDHTHLAERYAALKEIGLTPSRSTNHGMITSLYYSDPEDIKIEFYADNFASIEALNSWFSTGAFARDPIGKDIDFAEAARRLAAGEDPSGIFAPPQI